MKNNLEDQLLDALGKMLSSNKEEDWFFVYTLCENYDINKLYSTIKNLPDEQLATVSKKWLKEAILRCRKLNYDIEKLKD